MFPHIEDTCKQCMKYICFVSIYDYSVHMLLENLFSYGMLPREAMTSLIENYIYRTINRTMSIPVSENETQYFLLI